MHVFSYSTTGIIESISMDINTDGGHILIDLWHSELDEREFIETENDYEPLEKYIIKKYENLFSTMKELGKLLK